MYVDNTLFYHENRYFSSLTSPLLREASPLTEMLEKPYFSQRKTLFCFRIPLIAEIRSGTTKSVILPPEILFFSISHTALARYLAACAISPRAGWYAPERASPSDKSSVGLSPKRIIGMFASSKMSIIFAPRLAASSGVAGVYFPAFQSASSAVSRTTTVG